MSIKFVCESCATTLKVNERLAGKRIKCKACSAVVRVPAADADEFGSDFLNAEESGDAIEEPRLPPISRRPAEKKKPKKKSGSTARTVRIVVRSAVGLAAVGTLALFALAAVGWVTSRQNVGKLGRDINAIQAKAHTEFEATADILVAAMQNPNADLAPVEQQFTRMASVRDETIAELSALKIPAGVRHGQEVVAAAKDWISSQAEYFVTDGPAILGMLRDQSLPHLQRLAALKPRLQRVARREVEANLKLLNAQKTYLEQNRVPVSPDITAKISEQNSTLLGMQATATPNSSDGAAAGEMATTTGSPATTEAVPVVAQPKNAAPDRSAPPEGTVAVTDDMRLKPGMFVSASVAGSWSKGEISGVDTRFKVFTLKMLDGPFQGHELRRPAQMLHIDPTELSRTDLPEVEESPFKVK